MFHSIHHGLWTWLWSRWSEAHNKTNLELYEFMYVRSVPEWRQQSNNSSRSHTTERIDRSSCIYSAWVDDPWKCRSLPNFHNTVPPHFEISPPAIVVGLTRFLSSLESYQQTHRNNQLVGFVPQSRVTVVVCPLIDSLIHGPLDHVHHAKLRMPSRCKTKNAKSLGHAMTRARKDRPVDNWILVLHVRYW